MRKKIIIGFLSVLLLAFFISGYVLFNEKKALLGVDSSAVNWDGNKSKAKTEGDDSIRIPGFSILNFDANSKQQQVNFHNPEANDCYFKLSLLTPEGDTLWQSDLIEPGKGLYEIELANELAEGTYENAMLKYECFTYDEDQSPLNGSEINLTITVG